MGASKPEQAEALRASNAFGSRQVGQVHWGQEASAGVPNSPRQLSTARGIPSQDKGYDYCTVKILLDAGDYKVVNRPYRSSNSKRRVRQGSCYGTSWGR